MPFFPIMAVPYNGCPVPSIIRDSVSMGVNVMDSWWDTGGCTDYQAGRQVHWPTPQELHGILKGKVWWMVRNSFPGDLSGLPELLDLQGSLHLDTDSWSLDSCRAGEDSAIELYNRLKKKVTNQTTQGQAVVHYIYLLPAGVPGGQKLCLDRQRFSAQFWTALLAGAAGFEYDNHYVSRPDDGVAVRSDVISQAGVEAERLKTLYPVILTGASRADTSSNDEVIVRSWSWGGSVYAVAVNTENKPVTATIRWPGKATGITKVLWQDRSKKLVSGGITEQFRPHQVHIYQLSGRSRK